jgi:hypothetical protein
LTLQNIVETVSILLKIYHIENTLYTTCVWLALGLLHIGLCGGSYLITLQFGEDLYAANIITQWYYAFPIWTFLEYVVNTFPPIVMIHTLLLNEKERKREKSIIIAYKRSIKSFPFFYVCLVGQVVTTVIYCCVRYAVSYSEAMMDDLKWAAVANGVEPLVHIFHLFFNLVLTNRKLYYHYLRYCMHKVIN